MKIKNNSNYPKHVSGTRLEPGETAEVDVEETTLPRRVEVIEKSGSTGSDQNTKTKSEESEEQKEPEEGGEN